MVNEVFKNHNKITSFDIEEKSALALGSIVYLIKKGNNESELLENEFYEGIMKEISDCSTEDCLMRYTESLKNSKLSKSFEVISNLENCKNLTEICMYSLKAMNSFKISYFNQKLLDQLLEIYYNFESAYSTELRVEALNLIFSKYFQDVLNNFSILNNILLTLQEDIYKIKKSKNEFAFYTQRLISQKMKNSHEFRYFQFTQ